MDLHVSIDPGSTWVKAVASSGGTVRCPAVLTPSREGQGICVQGAWYVVGEDAVDAQTEVRTDPQQGAEYHGGPVQEVLLCEALRRLGLTGEQRISGLVVGMPYVLSQDVEFMAALRRRFQRFTWHQADVGACCVEADAVYFPPQGGGAVWEHMQSLTADGHDPEGRLVCVVDIGGQTADVVTVRYGTTLGAERALQGASASIGVNVEDFYRDLLADLETLPYAKASLRHLDYYGVMRRIEQRNYMLPVGPRRTYDMEPSVRRTSRVWTQRLLGAVQRVVGSRWAELDHVILTGGGAELVDPEQWDASYIKVDGMANVRGQLLCITSNTRRKNDDGQTTQG